MLISISNLCCPGGSATVCAGLVGYWPICGMGPWNDLASPTNCAPGSTGGNPSSMIDIWPNVFKTLTVKWTQDTGAWKQIVYQYQDYCDVPVTVTTTTGGGWYPPDGYTGDIEFTVPWYGGYTTFRQAYTYPPAPFVPGGTGIFMAVLSNQWFAIDPVTGADNWASPTNAARDLIMLNPLTPRYAIGTPSAALGMTAYFPVQDNSGYALQPAANVAGVDLDANYVCASAIGFPVRDWNFPPPFTFEVVVPAFPSIMDFDEPGGGIYANQGGVICVASTWVLAGTAPVVSYPTPTDHKTLFGQSFSPMALSSILQFYPSFLTVASGLNHPNPLTLLPISITFLPEDVLLNFAGINGASYGILGFHNNWAAGVDGNGVPYPAAGPIYLGAFPATGGAGGSGPQPGAGGGAPPV